MLKLPNASCLQCVGEQPGLDGLVMKGLGIVLFQGEAVQGAGAMTMKAYFQGPAKWHDCIDSTSSIPTVPDLVGQVETTVERQSLVSHHVGL